MPQAPSPNMQIIWPSDKDDANAWDAIMDTAVRVVIDGHTHADGDGAPVSISSLLIDNDINFVSGDGTKRAILFMKALGFAPVPTSSVVPYTAAFFLNSADNELYYRTPLGSNVKLTNGAALNFATFVGGIGGDYAGVAALLSFVDANSTYVFQQELGSGVRQYGKIRSSELTLYEFKGHPAAGVPVFGVTIASPSALAANYTLTLPAALPATTQGLSVDASGNITAGGKHGLRTSQVSGYDFVALQGAAAARYGALGGQEFSNSGSALGAGLELRFDQGIRILAIRVFIVDSATGPTKLQAAANQQVASTLATSSIGASSASAGSGAFQTLTISSINTTVAAGTLYYLNILTTTGTATCQILGAEIDYDRP